MKKIQIILFALSLITLSSCGYTRLGDFNMVSNRNIDSDTYYVLLERDVEGKAKFKESVAIETAVDRAVNLAGGEYLMNATIYMKRNGKIKVVGDVWGSPQLNQDQ